MSAADVPDHATPPRHEPSWHEPPWVFFQQALASGRLAHGLLIHGAPGVGKRVFVERVARALLCRARRPDGDACGACPACRQVTAGTHPDISRLMPEEAGRQIKVDQVRRFSQTLHLTSQYASGRLGWVDPAEGLSISAANSLLKTLEEPPLDCHLILVTDRLSALMPTIRSRCQLWRVPAATPEAGAAWLAERAMTEYAIDNDSLRAPFAVQARYEEDYAALTQAWDDDLARLLARRVNAVTIAERAAKAGRHLWIDWAYRRANALLAASLQAESAINALPAALRPAAARIEPAVFARLASGVARAARLAATNADWRLLIESVLLDFSERLPQSRKPL